jgi:hypothetical protein
MRIVAAQGCTAKVGGCSEHFSSSVDQLIMLKLPALSSLAQVQCAGRTRNIRGGGMADASLALIRRIQVIAVGIQSARSQPSVAYEAGFGNNAGENVLR